MTNQALTVRWVVSAVSFIILAGFAVRCTMEQDWLGVLVFGLTAAAVAAVQIVSSRGVRIEDGERSPDRLRKRPTLENGSLGARLNEFGWNALPVYLAVIGALFLVGGLAAADMRSAGFGCVLVGLSIFKRRQEGAWYRRF